MAEYGDYGYYCANCGHRGRGDSDLLPGTPGYEPGEVRVRCTRCGKEVVGKVITGWIQPREVPDSAPPGAGVWIFYDDATPYIDQATARCKQAHGGHITGAPLLKMTKGKREDGSTYPLSVFSIKFDVDDWWHEYAESHGWVESDDEY